MTRAKRKRSPSLRAVEAARINGFGAFARDVERRTLTAFLATDHALARRVRLLMTVCAEWPYDCAPPWPMLAEPLKQVREHLVEK